jgi:hypothetical protein
MLHVEPSLINSMLLQVASASSEGFEEEFHRGGGQRSEVRGQRAEGRGQRAEVLSLILKRNFSGFVIIEPNILPISEHIVTI